MGTLSRVRVADDLEVFQAVQAAQAYVQRQPVNCVDETTWPESGAQHWLWVNATEKATNFKLLAGRGQSEDREVIGSDYAGIATTDRLGAYNWLGHRRRQVCWAHLKRDFQCFTERGGGSEKVGECVMGCWLGLSL